MKLLTKTDFILYKQCPHNAWVKLHEPEEYKKFEVSDFEKSLAVMGNEVEELARGMFPGGKLVLGRGLDAKTITREFIKSKTPVIFQAAFSTDKYFVATDVLEWNDEVEMYDLYEIKMSSTEVEEEDETEDTKTKKINKAKEEQYEYDIAFQVAVLEMCGVKINKKYLIRLNKKYTKSGPLDFAENKLFIKEEKSEAVEKLLPRVLIEMEEAYEILSKNGMPNIPCQ